MSWAEESRPARTASRTVAQAAATAAMSGWGRPGVELAAQLRQLGAGEGRGEGAEQGDRVALARRRRCRRRRAGSGSSPTMPTTGVG